MKSSKTLSFKTSYDLRLNQLLENIHKLHITQAEKVGPNNSFYSDTKKGEFFLIEKNVKITKQ